MYVPLRGVMEIRSLVFKQRSVSWDSFGVVGQISRTSFICPPMPATSHTQTLPASLKDDTTSMNDRNKHKVTGQMNHQTAYPKANASVFLFFPTAHFLKTILASCTNGTFGFARHTSRPFAKPKELNFCHRTDRHSENNNYI